MFAIAALAGCGRGKERTIAVIPKGTSHEFWLTVEKGARAAGKEFHATILWSGPQQETEYTRQIEIVDSMIARHVDGIAVAAADRKILTASLDRAATANIPVTVFDSGVDSEQVHDVCRYGQCGGGRFSGSQAGRTAGREGKRGADGPRAGQFFHHGPGARLSRHPGEGISGYTRLLRSSSAWRTRPRLWRRPRIF